MNVPAGHHRMRISAPPGKVIVFTSLAMSAPEFPEGRATRAPPVKPLPVRAASPRPPPDTATLHIHCRIGRRPFVVKSDAGTTLPSPSSSVLSTAFAANTSSHP